MYDNHAETGFILFESEVTGMADLTIPNIIRKRKSIRRFEPSDLPITELDSVREKTTRLTPLYPTIRYTVDIVRTTKGIFHVKAPYYLIFRSETAPGYLENIGFIGQQMDLFLSGTGLGSCWLGMAKPEKNEADALPFVISMAFGKPAEPLYRPLADFKRKPLAEISEGDDKRLESARLAPSGMNAQNWYFIAEAGSIHCYRLTASPPLRAMKDRMACIDMGIALCHIAAETDGFTYTKAERPRERDRYEYMGTVQ
ncbi:MAG: nitroreductase [Clostridia bacterium]|nr:nitroreductase [Clostridia bacterium]